MELKDMSETDIDKLAERAAVKAVEKLTNDTYREIGRRAVKGAFYVIGVVVVAATLVALNKGWIKLP